MEIKEKWITNDFRVFKRVFKVMFSLSNINTIFILPYHGKYILCSYLIIENLAI